MNRAKPRQICIIHFQPIEQYPPVINLLQFAEDNFADMEITIVSNKSNSLNKKVSFASTKIKIKRIVTVSKDYSFIRRIFSYLYFYLYSFYLLVIKRPTVILYYETISSLPAIIYKSLNKKSVFLFAHYHEYTTINEYRYGMVLNRFNHWLEKKYYGSFTWLSQTNNFRLARFMADNGLSNNQNVHFKELPNYPTKNWLNRSKDNLSKPYKLVMLGAIGYETMYLKEIVEWANANTDLVTLDFYSNNIDPDAEKYLKKHENSNVNLKPALNYTEIPSTLGGYDIGLIIYKPFSENTIHAASNKLFEYLILGLDVWFPFEMEGSMQYVRTDCFPKVIPLDYNHLKNLNVPGLVNRDSLQYKVPEYTYEDIYPDIFNEMKKLLNGH